MTLESPPPYSVADGLVSPPPILKAVGAAAAGAAMAAALFCYLLNIHYHFWWHGRGHESACSKLNYCAIGAQANISHNWSSSSPTTRIQVPQKRIWSVNESEVIVPTFVVQQWSWLKLAQNPPQKSWKFKLFLGGMPPDPLVSTFFARTLYTILFEYATNVALFSGSILILVWHARVPEGRVWEQGYH